MLIIKNLLFLDCLLHKHGPANGLIVLFDTKNFVMGHMFRNNLRMMKKFFAYVQEGLPIKIHSIHILNTVPFFHLVMSLIKPFLSAEIAQKVKSVSLSLIPLTQSALF